MNPPTPDAKFKLKLKTWNPLYPPTHNETVTYVCDAGSSYNRFETDFNQWNYTLTCLPDNVFSEEPNVPWPTCIDSKKKCLTWVLI